jgi:hypothetical protein
MSEAYLVSGCELPPGSSLDKVINAACQSAGIKPHQIDEIHLYSSAASALFHRKQSSETSTIYSWPLLPLLPATGLRSICQSMEAGEVTLSLLMEDSPNYSSAILLANPIAVGRYNLTPLVHLANRLSHISGMDYLPTAALKTLATVPVEIEPEAPVIDLRLPKPPATQPWLALHSPDQITGMEWPANRLLQSPGLCNSLLLLAEAMQKSKTDRGVWMSLSPDGPVLSNLVLPL